MADVQPEYGYTKIADEILEQMARIKLSPTQYRILFVIWRYTYGFNRKEHNLTLGFISKATGCEKRQIQRELKDLEERRIIFQNVTNGVGRKIQFNKNHDEWIGKTTIGETTIGKTTIGETTIGETVNGTIGETVNGTIGETVNQDKQYLKTNLKTKYTPEFESFWNIYPRKIAKQVAFKRWNQLMKEKVCTDLIMTCARNYAKACEDRKTDPQFIMHPATFLNNDRYMDYEIYTPPYKPNEKQPPRLEVVTLTPEEESFYAEMAKRQAERNLNRNAASY